MKTQIIIMILIIITFMKKIVKPCWMKNMSFGFWTMQDGNKHVNLRQGDLLVVESLLHKTEVVTFF